MRVIVWVSLIVSAAMVLIAANSPTRETEMRRHLARAQERLIRLIRVLEDAKAASPELVEAMNDARNNLRDIDDEIVEIEEQQNSFYGMVTAALPFLSPVLGVAAYAGGRKHQAVIERRKARPSGGGAPSTFHEETRHDNRG